MKGVTGEKPFDCIEWTRRARDRINVETRNMTREERLRYFNRRPTDPILAEFSDRMKAKETVRTSAHGIESRAASDRTKGHDQPSSDPRDASDTNEETMNRNELVFDVSESPESGSDARALGHAVVTQGEDRDDLKGMLQGAVRCHSAGDDVPGAIRLHYVRQRGHCGRGTSAISADEITPIGSHATTATPRHERAEAT